MNHRDSYFSFSRLSGFTECATFRPVVLGGNVETDASGVRCTVESARYADTHDPVPYSLKVYNELEGDVAGWYVDGCPEHAECEKPGR